MGDGMGWGAGGDGRGVEGSWGVAHLGARE